MSIRLSQSQALTSTLVSPTQRDHRYPLLLQLTSNHPVLRSVPQNTASLRHTRTPRTAPYFAPLLRSPHWEGGEAHNLPPYPPPLHGGLDPVFDITTPDIKIKAPKGKHGRKDDDGEGEEIEGDQTQRGKETGKEHGKRSPSSGEGSNVRPLPRPLSFSVVNGTT